MTELKASLEELTAEERYLKTRNHLSRNSILITSGRIDSGSHSGVRQRSQSSRNSHYYGKHDRRFIRYENTYRMEPADDDKLDLPRARRVANSVIEASIAGYSYDANPAKQFSIVLAERIRNQMKQLSFSRYKIITQVSIGQNMGQDLRMVSRCLWDLRWDNHLTIIKESSAAYVIVTIFFIYTE